MTNIAEDIARSQAARSVTVCDKCLQASCWQGEFMCDNARTAGTIDMTIEQLQELRLEHSSYWESRT